MNYLLLKQLHMSLALISVSGFVLRWSWRMKGSKLASTRVVRILPHGVDTVFLASAFLLVFMTGGTPVSSAWLAAKVSGLVLYILLGMVAMRSAPAMRLSIPAFIAALLVFAWVVSVARLKTPLGFMASLLPVT